METSAVPVIEKRVKCTFYSSWNVATTLECSPLNHQKNTDWLQYLQETVHSFPYGNKGTKIYLWHIEIKEWNNCVNDLMLFNWPIVYYLVIIIIVIYGSLCHSTNELRTTNNCGTPHYNGSMVEIVHFTSI